MQRSDDFILQQKGFEDKYRQCKAVSFDIFDTMLLRPCLRPEDLFLLLERRCGLEKGFQLVRQNAEHSLRREQVGNNREITLWEIYQRIQKVLGLSSAETARIYEEEIQVELDHLSLNPQIGAVYKKALSENKKIIFCSDMYLPQEVIQTALRKNGITEISSVYVSSHFGYTKAEGTLFQILIKDLQLQGIMPEEILHIGDNWKSDFLNPREMGIKTVWYPSPIECFQQTPLWKRMRASFDWDCEDTFFLGNAVRLYFSPVEKNTESVWLRTIFSLCSLLGSKGGSEQNEQQRQAMKALELLLSKFPEFQEASTEYKNSFLELFKKDGEMSWGRGRLFSLLLENAQRMSGQGLPAFSNWKKQYNKELRGQRIKGKKGNGRIMKKEALLRVKEGLRRVPVFYLFLRKVYRKGRRIIENNEKLFAARRYKRLQEDLRQSFDELECLEKSLPPRKHTILVVGHIAAFDKGVCHYLNEAAQHTPQWNWVLLSETPAVARSIIAQKIHIPFLVLPKAPFAGCFDPNLSILHKDTVPLTGPLMELQEQSAMNMEHHFPQMGKGYAAYLFEYYAEYAKRCLSIFDPSAVLVWNEFVPVHGIWKFLCQEFKIPMLWMEFGSLAGTLAFDPTGQMGESWVCRHPREFLDLKVTETELIQAQQVCDYLVCHDCNRNPQQSDPDEEKYLQEKLVPDIPTIVYFGQSDYESGLYPYTQISKTYHSPYYQSSFSLLYDLAKLGKKCNWNIIYKPHPEMVRSSQIGEIPSNVIVMTNVSIFKLIEVSDVAVTIASQCSYEALLRDKPVVMLGYHQLYGKGIVYQSQGNTDLKESIERALKEGFSNSQKKAFILHIAQMLKYYLYDDLVPREKRFGKSQTEFLEMLESLVSRKEEQNEKGD